MSTTIHGLADLRRDLAALAPKLRLRALRNALSAGARLVRNDARQRAPIISALDPKVRAGHRKPGTLRASITVRTSKLARRRGDVGVFVNVRPAKAGARGAKSPADPYYWRWVEFGHKLVARARSAAGRLSVRARRASRTVGRVQPIPFLRPAAGNLGAALTVIMPKLQQAIAKLNQPKAPPP